MYTVTFIRQYSNASVINLYKEWDPKNNTLNENNTHSLVELSINDTYDCWSEGWTGTDGRTTTNSSFPLLFLIIPLELAYYLKNKVCHLRKIKHA